jgi:hypothetical protein
VTWRKTEHAANARFRTRDDQAAFIDGNRRRISQKSGEIVVKRKCRGVWRISDTSGALVPRTQIAGGIVRWLIRGCAFLYLAEPRAMRTVRRNQHPFPREWIESSMWNKL